MAALIGADMAPSLFTFVKSVTLRHRIITSRFLHGCVLYKRVKIVATRIPLRAGFISSFNWNKSCIDLVFPNNNKKKHKVSFSLSQTTVYKFDFSRMDDSKKQKDEAKDEQLKAKPDDDTRHSLISSLIFLHVLT